MKKAKPIAAVLVLSLLIIAGYYAYKVYFGIRSTALEASGTIEATSVELQAKSSGIIQNYQVQEGDPLKKDQLVAELDRKDLVAQKERDAMGVISAEAKLRELLSGARDQEIKSAQASVDLAKINLNQASSDLDKTRTLYQAGAASQDQLEKQETSYNVLQQQVVVAEAQLSLLSAGSRSEDIAAASAEVDRARAILKASQAILDDLKVVSPRDGVITSKNHENGEYVQPGTSLVTITDLNDLWIKVYIPTDQLPAIKLGQTARITVSGSSQVFTGRIKEIASKGEYTPKSIQTKQERTNIVFAVKVQVDNVNALLKPGMPADVVFDRS
ncbi:MAG TPA: HlyD family efflux transporter periplasmic adaptor subunit [Syntrophomonadaceae bacterium]|nr:HlyD family efflux transporter periplasmic adaptor subunit [Syntrophomonadaceae bacterium]